MTPLETGAAELVRALKRCWALDLDLTTREIAVLALACLQPPELRSILVIARTLGVSGAVVSRAATKLCNLKLTERVPDRHDLRKTMLEATLMGREMCARLLPAIGDARVSAAEAVIGAWREPANRDRDIIAALDGPMQALAAAFNIPDDAPATRAAA